MPAVEEQVLKEGGIPASRYNIAAATAAQEALSAGKPMSEVIAAAAEAKKKDEAGRQAPPAEASADEPEQLRDYLMCICQVLHGRFSHLSTARLVKIARLHLGSGIRSFDSWASDDE